MEATDAKCFINALDLTRQQAQGYALQITEMHSRKPFQWVEFEIVYNREGPVVGKVERSFEVYPRVDFGVLKSMLRECEENHPNDIDLIPVTRIEPIHVINVKKMRIVAAPQICRYVALSYVVSD